MTSPGNRCASCRGRFGLVRYYYWGLSFCRQACKDKYLAKSARDHALMRRWFGCAARPSRSVKHGRRVSLQSSA
jgi:hypothetical protein